VPKDLNLSLELNLKSEKYKGVGLRAVGILKRQTPRKFYFDYNILRMGQRYLATILPHIICVTPMNLRKTVHRIQYQVAKLEVLEILFLLKDRLDSSLDVRLAHSMMSTLRVSLSEACESCLEASTDQLDARRGRLKDTLTSVNNYLGQMVDGLPPEDPQALFVKEVMVQVIAELISLGLYLDATQEDSPFQMPVNLETEFEIDSQALPQNNDELELEILESVNDPRQ
jgi:hypothetical protein